jgi:hypothetical protein
MTIGDFRRIALSLEGAEEGSHMGGPVSGRTFSCPLPEAGEEWG